MIVFDSSTLILLAKIEILDIFIKNFSKRIIIPQEVERESAFVDGAFDSLLIKKRIEEKKVEVIKIKDQNISKKLMEDFRLDLGEAEVLNLALQEKAQIVATDDKKNILACKVLKIPYTSAIAILIMLKEKGLLTENEAKEKLERLSYYGRYKKSIIDDAKNRLEE